MAIYSVYLAALFHWLTAVGRVTEFITTLEVEVISTADLTSIKIIQGFFFSFLLDYSCTPAVFCLFYTTLQALKSILQVHQIRLSYLGFDI